jgi:hypothetical protein
MLVKVRVDNGFIQAVREFTCGIDDNELSVLSESEKHEYIEKTVREEAMTVINIEWEEI